MRLRSMRVRANSSSRVNWWMRSRDQYFRSLLCVGQLERMVMSGMRIPYLTVFFLRKAV